jgi:hypothetical protein
LENPSKLIFTKKYFVFFAWRNVLKEWRKRTPFDGFKILLFYRMDDHCS